jgi:CcmD family protein
MSRLSIFGRALAFVALLASAVVPVLPVLAQAPDADDGTSMAFRPMDESEIEDVDGGALMVAAYGTIFVLLLGYVLYLARIQAGTSAELVRLRTAIEKRRGYREPAAIDASPTAATADEPAANDKDA